MQYEGTIIRPPSEADSIILQVTVGCSHNRCSFCGAYKDKRFRIKDDTAIDQDLAFAARFCRRQKRVFLADGDALILPQKKLLPLLEKIHRFLPWVTGVAVYGNARSVLRKSPAELHELKSLGLRRIYFGLESGSDEVLLRISKGVDSGTMIAAGQRVREAGIFLSVTVLLGIAGAALSEEHALASARVLNQMQPNQIAALVLMVLENTPLARDIADGSFCLPGAGELLREQKILLENIQLDRLQFQSNHASNYLPLDGRLQRDKAQMLATIEAALAGSLPLVPERMRAL